MSRGGENGIHQETCFLESQWLACIWKHSHMVVDCPPKFRSTMEDDFH